MLKAIQLYNFVHFKEKYHILFEPSRNGFFLFVGANFCGKSTILELIRRCMPIEINSSVTNSFDKNSIAYAVCRFELEDERTVISGIINEKNEGHRQVVHKVLIYKDEDRTILRSCRSTFKYNPDSRKDDVDRVQSFQVERDKNALDNVFDKEKTDMEDVVRNVLNKIKSPDCSFDIKVKQDDITWKNLGEKYVATMPLRGIGNVQWTKSPQIGEGFKKVNYLKACEQAEIISQLLDRGEEIDLKKEQKIFTYLTSPQEFFFEKKETDEGTLIDVRQGNSPLFPLLKTSVGILEAKQVSLLLAQKHIKTLCLEEPDRGMHPQMIERLKRVLYEEGFHKTIIVATHSPYFIDTLSVENALIFFRKEPEKNEKQYVCGLKRLPINNELSKVHTVETYRTLLFGTKILLVEGPTDREIVQILFNKLRQTDDSPENSKEDLEITSYQIIPVHGCENAAKYRKFCKSINLPCVTLLDRDVYVKTDGDSVVGFDGIVDKKSIDKESEKFKKSEEFKRFVGENVSYFLANGFDDFSEYFKIYYNTFIWKFGDLEETIRSSEPMKSYIDKLLKSNDSLKNKIKRGLDRNEVEDFGKLLIEIPEIKRFVDYLKNN